MITEIPDKFFLVKGWGEGSTELNALDAALINAGIGNTNLVKVSSILPPQAKEISPIKIPEGSLVPVAYAYFISSQEEEIISAAVAVGIPQDKRRAGLIMEFSGKGEKKFVEERARQMVEEGMRIRNQKIEKIISTGIQHQVKKVGAVFAAVVLWK